MQYNAFDPKTYQGNSYGPSTDGQFSTDIFDRYQRNEKALLASILEMYVQGVFTRKVSKIVEELYGKKISKSFVSNLTKALDEMIHEWQYAQLTEKAYPQPGGRRSLY